MALPRMTKRRREALRAKADAEWAAHPAPPMKLDEHIATGRADAARWAELQREWV